MSEADKILAARLEYEAEMHTHIRMLQSRIADSERERHKLATVPAPTLSRPADYTGKVADDQCSYCGGFFKRFNNGTLEYCCYSAYAMD